MTVLSGESENPAGATGLGVLEFMCEGLSGRRQRQQWDSSARCSEGTEAALFFPGTSFCLGCCQKVVPTVGVFLPHLVLPRNVLIDLPRGVFVSGSDQVRNQDSPS